ncbi:hypothetical protein M0811_00811 [Anaeramoeba ignava]|uniref:RNA helicase n=1 Tax=Anaeramoeba ignava TaxID=1746090 RepID=A0A9Q0LJX4_ANAIG|nr:hypothetical protein M0811_00811 [Anaeramoeba ignava]
MSTENRKHKRNIKSREIHQEDLQSTEITEIKRSHKEMETQNRTVSEYEWEKQEKTVENKEKEKEKERKMRDQFVERLNERDEQNTKKYGEGELREKRGTIKKENNEQKSGIERLTTENFEEQKKMIQNQLEELKKESRYKYLSKRAGEVVDLMKQELLDFEKLYSHLPITEREYKLNQINKNMLEMVEQFGDLQQVDQLSSGYRVPKDYSKESGGIDRQKQWEALTAQLVYDPSEVDENTQQRWENSQISKADLHYGARKRKSDKEKKKGNEIITDEQIEFIKEAIMSGKIDEQEDPIEEKKRKIEEEKLSIQEQRKSLPIFAHRQKILDLLSSNQVIIIVGETGSGKTTQLTQYLHESGYTKNGKKVGCTQPRRVAAMSVAKRVADEMGVTLGKEVGYAIRFEDCTSDKTVVKYMTDGMMLREFLREPDLGSYSCIMIDEAHERTLHTDILFGLVKDLARYRSDLKLIISSATMDAFKFSKYFDDAPIYKIPGRRFPVDIYNTKAPEADYLDAAIVSVLQIHLTQPPGDILVFLTGQAEIEAATEILTQRTHGLGTKIGELIICPIYSALPSNMQVKIFEKTPPGARKVVLATNIAETSLTINGIVYVIDTGFCKQNYYNPRTGMESLIVAPISKASSLQRAGRAGRVAPGKCFRLYTKWSFENELDDETVPEIQRTNLASVVLMLKSLGIDDLVGFDFLDPPPSETLMRSIEQLYALAALNEDGELTKLGRRMAEFPLDPMMSKMIISSEKYKTTSEILTIASMLSVNNSIFYRPKDKEVHADNARKNFFNETGDHLSLLNVYNQWRDSNYSIQWCYENYIQYRSMKRAKDVRDQIENLCERVEIPLVSNPTDYEGILKTITSGFFFNTSNITRSGDYSTLKKKQTVFIHPTSALFNRVPKWVIFFEVVQTTKEYMRQISEIQPQWLIEIAPHFYQLKEISSSVHKMPKQGKGKVNSSEVLKKEEFLI